MSTAYKTSNIVFPIYNILPSILKIVKNNVLIQITVFTIFNRTVFHDDQCTQLISTEQCTDEKGGFCTQHVLYGTLPITIKNNGSKRR